MAIRGIQDQLTAEVEFAMGQGTAAEVIIGSTLEPATGTLSITGHLTQTFPLVSVVSMIGPSPDWFVGVDRLPPIQNDQWVSELIVDLQPYDAGVDNGTTYVSPDHETIPHQPVTQITGLPFSNGGPISPLGTFTFRRVDGSVPTVSAWGYAVTMLLILAAGSITLKHRAAAR